MDYWHLLISCQWALIVLIGNVFMKVARGKLAWVLPLPRPWLAYSLGTLEWGAVPYVYCSAYHFIRKCRFLGNLGAPKKHPSLLSWLASIVFLWCRCYFLVFPLYHTQQTPCDFIFTTLSSGPHQAIFQRRTKVSSIIIKHFKQLCFPCDCKARKLTSLGI